MARRVVYSALIGQYEPLVEQPRAGQEDVDFILFTDQEGLTSSTWQVHVVDRELPADAIRSARALKIGGHSLLENYEESLWLDNRVVLKCTPSSLFDDWLAHHDVAMPLHSFRESVLAEFEAVLEAERDDPARVYAQLSHYLRQEVSALDEQPFWTAIIARRHTRDNSRFAQLWLNHVMRYSRRDQLSVNEVVRRLGIDVRRVPLENRESDVHQWITREVLGRPVTQGMGRASEELRPLILDLRASKREIAEMRIELGQLRERSNDEAVRAAENESEIHGLRDALSAAIPRGEAESVLLELVAAAQSREADLRRLESALESRVAREAAAREGWLAERRQMVGLEEAEAVISGLAAAVAAREDEIARLVRASRGRS